MTSGAEKISSTQEDVQASVETHPLEDMPFLEDLMDTMRKF